MSNQLILVFIFGVIFIFFLLVIGVFILVRGDDKPVPAAAMFIFRVVLALAGAGFAAILPGFLSLQAKFAEVALQAGGALAVFIVIYRINPPVLIERQLVKPESPEKREIRDGNNRGQI